MQCFTELTAPTAVTHSLSLPFLSPSANNLVIAKTNLLQIFSLKSIVADARSSNGTSEAARLQRERTPTTKLVLVAQYELAGTVTSLARVKILKSKSGGEALLVALRDAKLSLVEWDPEKYSICTISIHYYEREDILASPWEPDLSESVNYLSVDPSSRCAALKFGARHLAILPFHQVGDDLVMDDYDAELDQLDGSNERPGHDASVREGDTGIDKNMTPYAASFVLSLLALDPALTHPIRLSFLYEYREPTFGILYSQGATSSALLHERKDNVSYAVYTLDLDQKASTTLLSVNHLPYDLHTIVPLSRWIGGSLLVGNNQIIHVDQSGKTNGIAVNNLAKQSTSFAMTDQSDLAMKLEGCVVKQLGWDNADLLIIMNTGELAVISFKIDGRSVSGLSIRRVEEDRGGQCLLAGPSCAAYIGRGRMFVGSESSNSVVLGWSRPIDKLKRQRSQISMDVDDSNAIADFDEDDIIDDEDEDDLYAADKPEKSAIDSNGLSSHTRPEDDYVFRVHDSMLNVGPMTDVAFVPPIDSEKGASKSSAEIVTTSGFGRAGGLTTFQCEVQPKRIAEYDIPGASAVWAICPKTSVEGKFNEYIITATTNAEGMDRSRAYALNSSGLEEVKDTDFDPEAGKTMDVGTLNGGTRVVQVLPNELRTYDGELGLAQIFPLTDEESETGPKVVSVGFSDPYVSLVRDDGSLALLRVDESGDLEEISQGQAVQQLKWKSGCLYEDSNDVFRLEYGEDSDDEAGNVLFFLLSAAGGLHIYRLPSLQKPVFTAEGLSFLPPFLSTEFTIRRSSARDEITDILVAELGDAVQKSPYLFLRSALDDLIVYRPYQSPVEGSKDTALRFVKISTPRSRRSPIEDNDDEEEEMASLTHPFRALSDLDGCDAVFMSGPSACFIIKSASSPPRVFSVAGGFVQSLSPMKALDLKADFVFINNTGAIFAASLSPGNTYSTGLITQSLSLGSTISGLSYHPPTNTFVLGTSTPYPFVIPEDESNPSYQIDLEDTSLAPLTPQGTIVLLDRSTGTIVNTHALDSYESVTCIQSVSLEISELTHERADMIAVGTAVIRGEDLPAMGRIYVFAVIDVVPEPEHPDTGRALKLVAKEEVKGTVTALSGVGTQGFLLVAQGQKCMVRGLKEDGTLLPVAFMDMQCYISVAKELNTAGGEGLCLMGDALKGVWLSGYIEDPYQLRLFGKSPRHIETIAGDFLPDGKQLYVVVADADCNLHILQFDPDNPKSLSGTRLLHHTTFHTSHYPSTLTLLPPSFSLTTTTTSSPSPNPHPLLLTSPTGSLSLLTPLPPSTHRTLSSLQTHCLNTLPHPLGLNPRGYRHCPTGGAGGVAGDGITGATTVIDGMVIRRWEEGGSWKRWGGEEREVLGGYVGAAIGLGGW